MTEIIKKAMPKAMVRKSIALSLTATVIFMAIKGEISAGTLLAIYGTVIGFYFGENAGARNPGSEMVD